MQEGTGVLLRYINITLMENTGIADTKKFQNIFAMAHAGKNQLCPVRDIISRISDKWTLLSVYALGGFGVLRFNELKNKIGDVSQRMLTVTLRNLESDGLVKRTVYPEVPPRVEYELTDLGRGLIFHLTTLTDWAEANSERILKNRTENHK